ncbi:hypothetical protein FocTR4_00002501 [Fusarium oxysporum f. sp. cubense]|uniref:Uncharacterized protein n=1 Tax=Fusarium oxysporum f. sp. cubense TaxID=61366 RepID=A0A5C6TDD9_FUSOC|nr:hypothetical protein FocTR4_00002501 [Fusarium oxysporum f. sp. cubense]
MRYTQSRSVEGAPNSVNNILAKCESRRVPPIRRLRTAKQLTTTPPSCLGISLFPLPVPLYFLFNQPSYHHRCKHTYRIINIHVIGLATMNASQQNATSGPQTDICARIPGNDNTWGARVSCYDSLFDLYDWVCGNSSEESPEILIYVSNIPHTFINIKDILTVSLNEPVSIVAFANPVNPLPPGWALVLLSPRSFLPGLREILGEGGAEWLVSVTTKARVNFEVMIEFADERAKDFGLM